MQVDQREACLLFEHSENTLMAHEGLEDEFAVQWQLKKALDINTNNSNQEYATE